MDELSQLLFEAKAGDESALAAFISRSQAEVWRLCAHLVGAAQADDATQETYLAAWRALPSFRGESSARTWLLVIARRTATRLGRRQVRLSDLDRESPGPTKAPDPQSWAELSSLIDQLDTDRRLAIVLTQILGLSYSDAAQVCGCAVGTIRSRVARAREQLVASGIPRDRTRDPGYRPRAIASSGAEALIPIRQTGT